VDEAKPLKIPKRQVWEAFKRVEANQGAIGVDRQAKNECVEPFLSIARDSLVGAGERRRQDVRRRRQPSAPSCRDRGAA
jgi:hypothetical protein